MRTGLREESTFQLGRTLIDRLGLLAQKEMELARSEGKGDVEHGRAAGKLGAAALMAGCAALNSALIAAAFALRLVMRPWLAALIGCGLFLLITALLGALAFREVSRARPRRMIRVVRATWGLFSRDSTKIPLDSGDKWVPT